MVLRCYQGWGGEELEKPAFEALATKPEIYGLDKSPIVPFSMIDWSAVVDYYKDNAKPNFNMRGTIPLLEDDNPKGKRFCHWDSAIALTGKHLPNIPQELGDCFTPDSMIRMYDGSEKAIQDIQVNDLVKDHLGIPRKVTRVIKKKYSGNLLTINTRSGIKSINCTPDHKLFTLIKDSTEDFDWVRADSLTTGDCLVQPKDSKEVIESFDLLDVGCSLSKTDDSRVCSVTSSKSCPRFIHLDTELAWMLGLFMADGSLEPHRLTFNLGVKKIVHAKRIEAYLQSIGVDCSIYPRADKPSVIYCRVNNSCLAKLFNSWITGNTYTKRIPSWVFLQSNRIQLAVLQGWIDGDGHIDTKLVKRKGRKDTNNCKIVGVSVNKNLINDLYRICNNIGVRPRINKRKAYKQSKVAYNLTLSGNEAVQAKPQMSRELAYTGFHKDLTQHGTLEEITEITRSKYDGFVYCLSVEHSNSFQVDGLAVHNCVAASAEMALEYLNATEVVLLGELDSYRPIYRPWLYGIGRVYEGKNQLGRGDGSITSWQIAGMKKYGCLYEDIPGLPAYSTQVGRDWGYSKSILDKWAPQAKDYIIEYSIPIGNFEELAKAVIIGKMTVVIASNQGFQMSLKKDTTNKKSWFIPSGTWSHQMHVPAVDYSAVPSLYVGNQWDESAHSGQLDGPDGGGWTDPEFFDRWAKRATVVAFARFRASKMKKPILKMR